MSKIGKINIVKTILSNISRLRLLVIGDIILDHYITGDARRISPEAPVPVVAVDDDRYCLGGAGNVAVNIARLGCDTEIVGAIGADRAGDRVIKLFHDENIFFDPNYMSPDINTIVKSRVVVRGQQLCRIDREDDAQRYKISDDIDEICQKIEHADAVILSDYAKGTFDNHNIAKFIKAANDAHTFIAVDPKPRHMLDFQGVSLMTPNRDEALELIHAEQYWQGDVDLPELGKKICEKYRPKNLVITLGANGMFIYENGGKSFQIPTYAQEVFDVSGAGDTSIACLTLALASGESLIRAAKFANIAAGIVVSKHGTVAITKEEMLNYDNISYLNL